MIGTEGKSYKSSNENQSELHLNSVFDFIFRYSLVFTLAIVFGLFAGYQANETFKFYKSQGILYLMPDSSGKNMPLAALTMPNTSDMNRFTFHFSSKTFRDYAADLMIEKMSKDEKIESLVKNYLLSNKTISQKEINYHDMFKFILSRTLANDITFSSKGEELLYVTAVTNNAAYSTLLVDSMIESVLSYVKKIELNELLATQKFILERIEEAKNAFTQTSKNYKDTLSSLELNENLVRGAKAENQEPALLGEIQKNLQSAELELEELEQHIKNTQIRITASDDSMSLKEIMSEMKSQKKSLNNRISIMREFVKQKKSQYIKSLDKMWDLENINKEIDILDDTNTEFEKALVALKVQEANITSKYEVITKGSDEGARPLIASTYVGIAMSFLFVFLASIGVIIFEAVTPRVRIPNHFYKFFITPIGVLPKLNKDKDLLLTQYSVQNLPHFDGISTGINSYRSLRRKFMQLMGESNLKVFSITSSREGCGKTTLALNLATLMYESKKKVLLIDADIIKQTLTHNLEAHDKLGISNFTTDDVTTLSQSIVDVRDGFHFLPAGNGNWKSFNNLPSKSLENLFLQLKSVFDVVIIDTVPVLESDDSFNLNQQVDGVIFVANSGETRQSEVQMCLDTMGLKAKRNLFGVLNFAPQWLANAENSDRSRSYSYATPKGRKSA